MHELDILWRLGLALLLSSAIGVEREMRQKMAGLRTYSLVGVGAALFMLVSIFGFGDMVGHRSVSLDPSRVAAQIVSGIGFIGGGIIFVRRDTVKGLTTAAGVWVTAAVGMACGGDLPVLAVATTLVYFVVAYLYPELVRRLPRSRDAPSELRLVYLDGHGISAKLWRSVHDADFRSPISRSSTPEREAPTATRRLSSRLSSKFEDAAPSPSSPPSSTRWTESSTSTLTIRTR